MPPIAVFIIWLISVLTWESSLMLWQVVTLLMTVLIPALHHACWLLRRKER